MRVGDDFVSNKCQGGDNTIALPATGSEVRLNTLIEATVREELFKIVVRKKL